MVVGNDWVSPTDFWDLPPGQIWWLIDAKMPASARARGSEMTQVRKMVREAKMKEAA